MTKADITNKEPNKFKFEEIVALQTTNKKINTAEKHDMFSLRSQESNASLDLLKNGLKLSDEKYKELLLKEGINININPFYL